MRQVPASVWNEIAKTQELSNPSMKVLFAMKQNEMDAALEAQSRALEKSGTPDSVINAYQVMAPLLAENQAISQYINQTGNSDLRSALPEILNAQEAVSIAALDRPLSNSEQSALLELLQPMTPASSINV